MLQEAASSSNWSIFSLIKLLHLMTIGWRTDIDDALSYPTIRNIRQSEIFQLNYITHPIDQDGNQNWLSFCVHHLLFRIIQQHFADIFLIYTFDESTSIKSTEFSLWYKESKCIPDIWNIWSFDGSPPAHRSEYKSSK